MACRTCLPALLGAMALASVVVMLVSVARRRRRDLAVLRSLGFDRRDLRSMLAAQSTAFTLLAALVGIPLGIVVGRRRVEPRGRRARHRGGPTVPLLLIAAASIGGPRAREPRSQRVLASLGRVATAARRRSALRTE